MSEKKVTNAQAVKTYHSKLVNLATIRVPSPDICGIDYKAKVYEYLNERYGEKKISMNEYLIGLINADMNEWYKSEEKIIGGVKSIK